jgi:hypothetical protein
MVSLALALSVVAGAAFYTRHDWTLKPRTLFQGYLLFTIVFYFYRWTFQWGPPETTIFDGDAPGWVRIIKDLVFVAFILLCAAKGRLRYSPLIWYLLPFAAWLSLCTWIELAQTQDAHDLLFHWRTSLEYLPIAFVACEEDLEQLLKFGIGCCWIVVAFLAMEATSGRPSGFVKDTLVFSRFGSIFGSPNELGAFAMLALLGMVVFAADIPTRTRVVLLPALCATLLLSVSRSSVIGLVAGLAVIWPKSKRWLLVIAGISIAFYLALFTLFRDTAVVDDLVSRIGDVSATSRFAQVEQAKQEVNDWGIGGIILGSVQKVDQENYYFGILLRSGLVGVLLLCLPLLGTLLRARHPFLRGGIVAIATASLFVPYLDIFPPSVYFWLMVGAAWSLSDSQSTMRNLGACTTAPLPLMQRARA